MYYESGMFPILAAEATTSTTKTKTKDSGPIANSGETPPPPEDPPKG